MTENEISKVIFDCALKVHRTLGPGFLENVYESSLLYELEEAGMKVRKQELIPLIYKNVNLENHFRADLIVEEKVIIEVKSIELLKDEHVAHVLTCLRLSGRKLGMLMNFNVALIKDGIKRVVNNL